MRIFSSMDISGSGLTAERLWMDIIADNIANIHTTKTKEGGPYKRKVPVFQERTDTTNPVGKGVKVARVDVDSLPPQKVDDPSNPDADKDGYVKYPNISVVREMVDMIAASRAYQANIMVINSSKSMLLQSIDIMKT